MVNGRGRSRALKLRFLHLARWLGLFNLARLLTRNAVRILCYHGVWLGDKGFAGDAMFMNFQTFARRLDIIKHLAYPVISLSQAAAALNGDGVFPACSVVITIDDGWYSTFVGMLPALRERSMPATLYCDTAHLQSGLPVAHMMAEYLRMTARPAGRDSVVDAAYAIATNRSNPIDERLRAVRDIAQRLGVRIDDYLESRVFHYMTPGELEEASRAGLDVQLHTHNHTMHDLSPGMLRQEIVENRRELAKILGCSPGRFQHFCYPSGVANSNVAEELERLRITSSTTTRQGIAWPRSKRQLLPRILDGEHMSEIEFEAELSGFGEFVRLFRRLIGRWRSVDA